MNYLTILFSILIGLPGLVAQDTYSEMSVDGAIWIYGDYMLIEAGDAPLIGAYVIQVRGDTIIDGLEYRKIYKHQLKVTQVDQSPYHEIDIPYTVQSTTLHSAIREDTDQQVVYILPLLEDHLHCNLSKEYLLYDFSLAVQDTLNDCVLSKIWNEGFPEEVPVIDSITLEYHYDGDRQVFNTTGVFQYQGLLYEEPGKIIEGIGYERYGIYNGMSNRLIGYCRGSLWECNIISSTKATVPIEIMIYPNPGFDRITIETEYQIDAITAYDVQGHIFTLNVDSQGVIDVSHLSKGVYLLGIASDHSQQLLMRWVKM